MKKKRSVLLPHTLENDTCPIPGPMPTPCLIWLWAERSTGYGAIRINGRMMQSHRYFYERLVGKIPEGMQLDHLCRTRLCQNPLHLEPVTCRENLMRGNTHAARNAAKTHCKRGHQFDNKNTYLIPAGGGRYRACRECNRITNIRYRMRAGGVT